MLGLCFVERGGTLTHKHFHGRFSSLLMSNKKEKRRKKKGQKICLGWDKNPSTTHVVSWERLRDESLLAFKDMVECCMKNSREEHFEFECHMYMPMT
jgi:hypothetical protein